MTETTLKTTYSFPTEDEKEEARIAELEAQVSSLTKERDELNTALKCEKAFKEGSEKANSKLNEKCNEYVKFYQQERKNVIDLETQIQEFKSQLSNRDKEIEELKGKQKWKFSMIGFQAQVGSWIVNCFGKETAFDRTERNWRFIEEALELIQALGANAEDAHKMVDYTFSREKGDPAQEVGGVMVTLAALCEANKLLIHKSATTELKRITAPAMMNKIRAKHASKPHKSPLPGDYNFSEEALASLNKEGEEK